MKVKDEATKTTGRPWLGELDPEPWPEHCIAPDTCRAIALLLALGRFEGLGGYGRSPYRGMVYRSDCDPSPERESPSTRTQLAALFGVAARGSTMIIETRKGTICRVDGVDVAHSSTPGRALESALQQLAAEAAVEVAADG